MTNWVRLWEDMPTDPKWRVIARKSGQPIACVIALFNMLMLAAGRATPKGSVNGFRAEDAAAALDMDDEDVSAILTAMEGRVIEDGTLTGWDKRQPKREDTSTERVREHRERLKQEAQHTETHRNAPEADTETERKNTGDTSPVLSVKFEEFKRAYPPRFGGNPWKPAEHIFRQKVKSGASPDEIIACARRYAAEVAKLKGEERKFVKQAHFWLKQDRWADALGATSRPCEVKMVPVSVGTEEWEAWCMVGGHSPTLVDHNSGKFGDSGGWMFESRWPPGWPANIAEHSERTASVQHYERDAL